MKILAVDDEKLALEALESAIHKVLPDAEAHAFRSGAQALEFADEHFCQAAFLDIEMRDMSGLELAKRLKERHGETNIVFVTGYTDYAVEAFDLYASGYLLKPVTAEKVRREMENLRHPLRAEGDEGLRIQCFGNFEVFFNGKPLIFKLNKTKEMLAYLVDRQGARCTMGELMAVLWEDRPDSSSQRSQTRKLIADLRATLAVAGAEDLIIKQRGVIAINAAGLNCDYYDFLQAAPAVVKRYQGEYMSQYSWAEITTAAITDR